MTKENKDQHTKAEHWEKKYYECLALEFNNPEYFKVHHLFVLTYMLQTNGYSDGYHTIAINLLKNFLNNTITPQEFRLSFQNFEKTQNSKNGLGSREIEKVEWKIDILDIRTENAEQYSKDVRWWAENVLTVLERVIEYDVKNHNQKNGK